MAGVERVWFSNNRGVIQELLLLQQVLDEGSPPHYIFIMKNQSITKNQ